MRATHAIVMLGLILGPHMTAQAIEPGAPERLLTYDVLLAERLEHSIASLPAKKDDKTIAAIRAFYSGRNFQPLWTSGAGLGRAARKVIEEIARADDYGLEADKFDLPDITNGGATKDTRLTIASELKLTRAVLKYAVHARGGRIDPRSLSGYLDRGANLIPPAKVLAAISLSKSPDAYLRGLHPQYPEFERLRQRYLSLRRNAGAKPEVRIPDGPVLSLGKTHDHVALLRKRLNVPVPEVVVPVNDDAEAAADPEAPKIDVERLRRVAARTFDEPLDRAVRAFQKKNSIKVDGVVGSGTRRALNGDGVDHTTRLLVNMERWRWMPDNPGKFYVWANIPDFRFYVIKDGRIVHTERVVVGKYQNQTASFSDQMEEIVFNPRWHVPNSIKQRELLPALLRSGNALSRQGLRVKLGNTDIDPGTVNWSTADISKYHIYQPSGPRNALGRLKFLFPNKHSIYMHDTPSRSLFSRTRRAFSHGCVRVRNPQRFAEVILAHDQGISRSAIQSRIRSGVRSSIFLKHKIPVHITYFTARADDATNETIRYLGDIYRHDKRIAQALAGKPPAYIAVNSLGRQIPAKRRVTIARKKKLNWADQLFGWN